jgi:hypothetical protein
MSELGRQADEIHRLQRVVSHYEAMQDDIIEDGFGSVWPSKCEACGYKTMQVVRPGKCQCGLCNEEGLD